MYHHTVHHQICHCVGEARGYCRLGTSGGRPLRRISNFVIAKPRQTEAMHPSREFPFLSLLFLQQNMH